MKMVVMVLALMCLSCSQDTTPPTVVSTVPANGDRDVAPGPMIMSATLRAPSC